jgi:hypothetical protein
MLMHDDHLLHIGHNPTPNPSVSLQMTVNPGGDWQKYVMALPNGAESLGIVEDLGMIGALIRFVANGLYVQAYGNKIASLDQFEVLSALAAAKLSARASTAGGAPLPFQGLGAHTDR